MRRAAGIVAIVAVGVTASSVVPGAGATEGNLYPYGASIWAVSSQFARDGPPGARLAGPGAGALARPSPGTTGR